MIIEEKLVKYLTDNKLMIATAESCTGGLISKRITDISGASAVFGYGLCTYANEAKSILLDVKKDTLEHYGAVSSQVAEQMAEGLIKLSQADIAICTTGMASPGWYPTDKPVGLVFVGIASKKFGTRVLQLNLGELVTREKIRNASADAALTAALEEAEKIVQCNLLLN